MAGICKSFALSCRAKRLAWATSSPDFPVVAPSGRPEGVGPNTDACEEMALREAAQVAGVNIFDAPFVHDAGRDVPSVDKVAQPLSRERVYLVVVSGHVVRNEKARTGDGLGVVGWWGGGVVGFTIAVSASG